MARKNRGERGFTIIELVVIVIILAILAFVAIPAFINYMRRAKTTEATMMLDRMWEGATKYFYKEHVQRGSDTTSYTRTLPGDCPQTPDISNVSDEILRAQAFLSSFQQNPNWNALDFAMTDNFYYSYSFDTCTMESNQCVAGSLVTGRAQGDLDADNFYSLFERAGRVSYSEAGGWSLEGAAGVYKSDPLE